MIRSLFYEESSVLLFIIKYRAHLFPEKRRATPLVPRDLTR